MDTNWTPFWFETNSVWGAVKNQEDWTKIRKTWKSGNVTLKSEDIYTVARSERQELPVAEDKLPSFGTRGEHTGGAMTLGEFFDKNGMDRNISA